MTEQLTFPTASDVCELVYGDPLHQRDRAAVIEAMQHDARTHDREVNSNRVRALIPPWVYSRVIGSTYNALVTRGVLLRIGATDSTDRKGRNAGKQARIYRWTGDL